MIKYFCEYSESDAIRGNNYMRIFKRKYGQLQTNSNNIHLNFLSISK